MSRIAVLVLLVLTGQLAFRLEGAPNGSAAQLNVAARWQQGILWVLAKTDRVMGGSGGPRILRAFSSRKTERQLVMLINGAGGMTEVGEVLDFAATSDRERAFIQSMDSASQIDQLLATPLALQMLVVKALQGGAFAGNPMTLIRMWIGVDLDPLTMTKVIEALTTKDAHGYPAQF
jgi:hypothetical protein